MDIKKTAQAIKADAGEAPADTLQRQPRLRRALVTAGMALWLGWGIGAASAASEAQQTQSSAAASSSASQPEPGTPTGSSQQPSAQQPTTPKTCTAQTPVRLVVTVTDVRNTKGNMALTLYPPDKDRWLSHHGQLFIVRVPATTPQTQICVALPAVGDYALSVYHDENDDHDFNTNWLGLPSEPYGISRNPSMFFGPPSLDNALFHADKGETKLSIDLDH